MTPLTRQRCFNHATREAAARCTRCGRFFCRECIAAHEERLICAGCLREVVRVPPARRRALAGVARVLQLGFGLVTAWFFFHLVGELLLSLPDSFHEGTLWRRPAWEEGR